MRILAFILTLIAISTPLGASQPAKPPAIRPAVERIDVVPGRPLVLPVEIIDDHVLRRGEFETRLDDGLSIVGELYWIGARLTGRSGWVGPEAEWSATPSRQAVRSDDLPVGRWYLVCSMPPEAVGLGMWFAGERAAVNWLPDPWRLGRDAEAHVPEAMWAGTLPEGVAQDTSVLRAIDQLAKNPWSRWRARLMLGHLEPDHSFADSWVGPSTFDGVIEDLARYQDGLWQVAMARLWIGDERAMIDLRARLGEVARFDHSWAPVFPASPINESDLRADLLNPFVDEQTLGFRARAWQISQPIGVAWSVDDSGRTDASTGRSAATIGVMALGSGSPLLTLAGKAPEPIQTARQLNRVLGPGATSGLMAQRVPVRIGAWRSEVGVVRGKRPANPPGVSLGPLVNDWTQGAWFLGRESEGARVRPGLSTLATLFREGTEHWKIRVECRTPFDESLDDELTLWLGPSGSPAAVIRLDRHGNAFNQLTGEGLGAVPIAQTQRGWVVIVDLPRGVIEPDGTLRLGFTRASADGSRTAWPRRMLPWDTEPGRLAIDLNAWDGF